MTRYTSLMLNCHSNVFHSDNFWIYKQLLRLWDSDSSWFAWGWKRLHGDVTGSSSGSAVLLLTSLGLTALTFTVYRLVIVTICCTSLLWFLYWHANVEYGRGRGRGGYQLSVMRVTFSEVRTLNANLIHI